jgi:hypothetical protein
VKDPESNRCTGCERNHEQTGALIRSAPSALAKSFGAIALFCPVPTQELATSPWPLCARTPGRGAAPRPADAGARRPSDSRAARRRRGRAAADPRTLPRWPDQRSRNLQGQIGAQPPTAYERAVDHGRADNRPREGDAGSDVAAFVIGDALDEARRPHGPTTPRKCSNAMYCTWSSGPTSSAMEPSEPC